MQKECIDMALFWSSVTAVVMGIIIVWLWTENHGLKRRMQRGISQECTDLWLFHSSAFVDRALESLANEVGRVQLDPEAKEMAAQRFKKFWDAADRLGHYMKGRTWEEYLPKLHQ